jgi:hypothetical protein
MFQGNELRIQVPTLCLKQALTSVDGSKKMARQRTMEQNRSSQAFYVYNLSHVKSYRLVYVSESGCDESA